MFRWSNQIIRTPCTTPGSAFDQDELIGTRSTDTIDTSLIECCSSACRDIVWLIVDIEDDISIRYELAGEVLPESFETAMCG
jgi:hypothetical protein